MGRVKYQEIAILASAGMAVVPATEASAHPGPGAAPAENIWTLMGVYDNYEQCQPVKEGYEKQGYQSYCTYDMFAHRWNLEVYYPRPFSPSARRGEVTHA